MYSLEKEIKSCTLTGHRELGEDFDIELLKKNLISAIEEGIIYFLCGMAEGFDLSAAEAVLLLKKEYPHIKLLAYVPCPNQSSLYCDEDKERYDNLISEADEIIKVSKFMSKANMLKRDRAMVENSSMVIAYLRKSRGGTHYTCTYAEKLGKRIFII